MTPTNGKTAETIRLTDGVTESANKIPPKKGVDVDISVPHLSWLDKISEWMSQPMSKLINVDFSVPDWVKKGMTSFKVDLDLLLLSELALLKHLVLREFHQQVLV